MARYQLIKAIALTVNGTHLRVRAGQFLADSGGLQGDVPVTTQFVTGLVASGAAVPVGSVGQHPDGVSSIDA
jgi:hypothetical protein